ncbi:hypothetical protein AMAG_08686 [Allomyces macrogynus ATCC 38327]|uniref:EGF-like domain-containing protein n=1 Tax=Allomyces macrogynus (strain ATCC 38327) TaxID=578462 RepID=A0A0L0SMH9_ALLM3|nr:hypothetical protein AMAG_08686 [Allomyces macrogynus ATCC 38327]|eukprot:KNE63579.1 hypothetical protein AMAG_08686 [Allomyces macrogynus ATCC 38327]
MTARRPHGRPNRGFRASAAALALLLASIATLSLANPVPASSNSTSPIPITLVASDFKTLSFTDAKSSALLYAPNTVATTRDVVDGALVILDATNGAVHALTPFARAKWVAHVPDRKKQVDIVLSWSSVWAQLTAFVVDGAQLVPAARVDEAEEDVAGLCAGWNGEGQRVAVLVTKGGWVKYYVLDVDRKGRGPAEVKMRRIQAKFVPLQPAEVPSACTIPSLAPHHALIATGLGNVYDVDFSAATDPSPTPIYHATTEIPSIVSFYLDGDTDTAYALVAENDSALTILSRSRSTTAWYKVTSVTLKPTVTITDVSGVSVASSGAGFDRGVLVVTAKGTGFYYFALDRVLAAAGIGKAGTRVLGEMPEAMETKSSCTACNGHGFCSGTAAAAQCVCHEGFIGASCDTRNPCPCATDRGTCTDPVRPAVCTCKFGYMGATCSVPTVTPALTLRASNRFENKGSAEDNDDPEVYVHPSNPDDSVVLGTTKSKSDGGLHVWAMDGTELWYAPVPKKSGLNSVDVLVNVTVRDAAGNAMGETVDVAVAGVRGKINGIGVWRIDPAAISANRKTLAANRNATQADLAPVLIPLTDFLHEFDKDTELEVYGSCAFTYSPKHASTPADTLLITTKKGVAYQFTVSATRTSANKEPTASLTLARRWTVGLGTQLENCVGDGETGALYIGEEAIGVWRYDLGEFDATEPLPAVPKPTINPTTGRFVVLIGHRTSARDAVLVDATQLANPAGQLHRDVEGLAIYVDQACPKKTRTLVVSAQGANEYNFYTIRSATEMRFRGKVAIQTGPGGDAVTKTDSLAVSSAKMGAFARGVLVVHDDATTVGEDLARVEKQATFKVVDWRDVDRRVQQAGAAAAAGR